MFSFLQIVDHIREHKKMPVINFMEVFYCGFLGKPEISAFLLRCFTNINFF